MRGWVTTLRKWPGVVRALLWACLEVCTCMSRQNEDNERKWIVICYHNGNNKSCCTWNCSEEKADKDKGFISLDLFSCFVVVNMRMHLGGCRSVVFFCFFLSFFISSLIKCLFVYVCSHIYSFIYSVISGIWLIDWMGIWLHLLLDWLVCWMAEGFLWCGTVLSTRSLYWHDSKKKTMLPYKRE